MKPKEELVRISVRIVLVCLILLGAILKSHAQAGLSDLLSAATADKKRRLSSPSKLDAHLENLAGTISTARTKADSLSKNLASLSNSLVKVRNDGMVQVYVKVLTNVATETATLQAHGAVVEVSNEEHKLIQAWVPAEKLQDLAALPQVQAIRPPDYGVTSVGSKQTQGDRILKADQLRARGIEGAGVRVGVISDGNDGYTAAQASGDLPSGVQPVTFPGNGAEGTAMLEIVHDIAPKAQLGFCGPRTTLEMIVCVNDLANVFGADIIVDDLAFLGEPYFEDGIVAQAVSTLVTRGVFYTSSAGNFAREHYENNIRPITSGQFVFHDFGAAAGGQTDPTLGVTLQPGATLTAYLQWNDPWGRSANDYDLFLYDQNITALLALSINRQAGVGNPFELIQYANTSGQARIVNLVITKVSGVDRRLEIFTPKCNCLLEYPIESDSIVGHQAVPGVVATAAIGADEPGNDLAQSYSSRGPSTIFFPAPVVRTKPDIAAIDGVEVTGSGGFATPFSGTSAASPHVAGVAALLKNQSPGSSAADLINALRNSAVDLGTPGQDTTYGAGRIDALAAANLLPFGLTVNKAGTGSGTVTSNPAGLNCGAICSATFPAGTSVTLTAIPSAGSVFTGWSNGACSGTSTCVLSASAPTITATFNPAPSSATGGDSGGGGCVISPSGTMDPTLLILLLLAVSALLWKRWRSIE